MTEKARPKVARTALVVNCISTLWSEGWLVCRAILALDSVSDAVSCWSSEKRVEVLQEMTLARVIND